jgi:hypothetical protein
MSLSGAGILPAFFNLNKTKSLGFEVMKMITESQLSWDFGYYKEESRDRGVCPI